jgi:diaminopimelate decarboxylase
MDGVSFENSTNQFYACLDSKSKEPSGIYETQNSTLFGMTCDGMDIITKSINVPNDLKVSDWLCLSGMGAYTYGCKSTFNGMKATDKVIKWPTNIRAAQ